MGVKKIFYMNSQEIISEYRDIQLFTCWRYNSWKEKEIFAAIRGFW